MKKRNLMICAILSASMLTQLAAPALASDSETTGTETTTEATAPDGEAPSGEDGGTPPEKPDGEAPSDMGEGGPSGDNGGTPPEMPEGMSEGEMPEGGPGEGGQGGPGGGDMGGSESVEYSAVNEYSSDSTEITGESLESTGTDENAVLVDGDDASVTISDSTVTRTSDDSDSNNTSSFYGNAAALLATAGTLTIDNTTIETSSGGGAGVFSYGTGTVWISDSTIHTTEGTSGGIHVAGGGTLYASNLTVTTEGGSSAAIRSDKGGGTMVVDGGTYTSQGTGSPAVYSTADITIHDATLTAENSEATCIEGLNTIRLFDCDLSGNMPDDNEQNEVQWNVIVYQSMSGDSEEGNGTFEMVGGTLTANAGGMFYTTNTESTFILNGVDITYAQDSDFFLRCTGNANGRGWGNSGANGADCTFTGISQAMEGSVIWDQISNLDFYITESSTLTGDVVRDDTYSGGEGDGYCSLYIDETSSWIVTGDSTLTNLYCAGTITDADGNTVSIVGTDGTTYVEGDSQYTITVDSYSDSVDLSGASAAESWEDYAVSESAEA